MYQNWTMGVGGACDVYDPPRSPWCSGVFYLEREFPEMHTRHPSGVAADQFLPHSPYSAPEGGIVHAWRPGVYTFIVLVYTSFSRSVFLHVLS